MKIQDLIKVENTDDADELFDLGVRLGEKGDFKGAIEAFNKGLEINPKETVAWVNLGLIYGQKGDLKTEMECYANALKLDPNNMQVWVNLGVVMEELDNFKKGNDVSLMVSKRSLIGYLFMLFSLHRNKLSSKNNF